MSITEELTQLARNWGNFRGISLRRFHRRPKKRLMDVSKPADSARLLGVACSALAGKKCHFAEKVSFAKHRNWARFATLGQLHLHATVVHHEHRRTLVASANERLAGREDVADGRHGQLAKLICRKRSKYIDRREAIGDFVFRRRGSGGDLSFEVKGAGRKCEGQAVATQCVPGSLTNERIGVVILGVILQPVFYFPFNRRLAKIPDSHNRRNFLRHVVSVAHGFANDMNCLGRRVSVNSAEEDQSRIQVVARRNFDSLLGGVTVANKNNVVLKSSDLYRAPGDSFNYPRMFLLADNDHVSNLKGTICLKRDAREEVSQRVLQCETNNYAKNC